MRPKDRATRFGGVGAGLRIRVTNRENQASFEKLVVSVPVRLGRDPLNDVVLDYPFVSKFHVVVDASDGALFVRDLGSRNGTRLQGGTVQVPANSIAQLAAHGNAFSIGTLQIAIERTEIAANDPRLEGAPVRSLFTGRHVETARGVARADLPPATAVALQAAPNDLSSVEAELRPYFEAYRREWIGFHRVLLQRLGPMSRERRAEVLTFVAQQFVSVRQEVEFQGLCDSSGAASPEPRGKSRALAVLRELADWYLGRTLQTDEDIDGFADKLRRALDVFLLSFVPLRNGLRRSQTELAGIDRTANRSRLESAVTPLDVATILLDWRNPSDESQAVHGIFADMMVHQVGLVSGVMKGVEALLEKLAPSQIESDVRTKGGFTFGPWRFPALWSEFRRRHDDYRDEPFSVIFGREFEKMYRQLFDEVAPREANNDRARGTGETHEASTPPVGPYGTVVVPRAPKK